MDTMSVAYVLCRIEDDSSLTPVSQHGDFLTGIAAGGYAVEVEDSDFAYALYSGDPSNGSCARVASFRGAGSAIGSGQPGVAVSTPASRIATTTMSTSLWHEIVATTRARSYEERTCLRCFEGRVYGHAAWRVGGLRAVLGHWAGDGLPLP
jgi:hypothetical protein